MQRLLFALIAVLSGAAFAQYTPSAGQNTPAAAYLKDTYGNASGNQYDLAVDGAFAGQTVLVLNPIGYSLEKLSAALKEKGLTPVIYGATPLPEELERQLAKASQLWLLSGGRPTIDAEHVAIIKEFFDAGHGVYIWGDNDPYYVDANLLASSLIPGLRMEGCLAGNKVVNIAGKDATVGLRSGHLVTTGLEHLYEGYTIATIQFTDSHGPNPELYEGTAYGSARAPELPKGFTPLLYGSAGNLVTVAYERQGKRLMMDGGFTRLEMHWDDAGTARYVKNAAAWLVHSERFKETVANRR